MISVVIPLYNKGLRVLDTINSVLQQSFKDFEIIVVNDGSTDDSLQIVQTIIDSRVRIINKKNGGVSSARNKGLKEAKYEWIAFVDADDLWLSNHLSEMYRLITKYSGEADVFVTNFARKYSDGRIIVNRTDLKEGLIDNYFKRALRGAVINSSCVCVSKKAFDTCGGFNENYSYGEDIDLWSRLARRVKIAYSSEVTQYYIMGTENNASVIKDYQRAYGSHVHLRDSINLYDFIYHLEMVLKVKIRTSRINKWLKI